MNSLVVHGIAFLPVRPLPYFISRSMAQEDEESTRRTGNSEDGGILMMHVLLFFSYRPICTSETRYD